jgi:nitrate reductase gamma subunit
MSYLDQLLFGYYPYVALTVFVVGSIIRFDRGQYGWRSGSSQLLRRRQLVLGSNLFHVGILMLFIGHLVGLLAPAGTFQMIGMSYAAKQMLAIVAGGIFGIMCLVGLTMLIHRRLTDPRILLTSTRMDLFILGLLWVQLVIGLVTIPFSLGHRDGSMMLQFMAWAQGIFTFQPGVAALVADTPFVFKLHLFLGLTLFLVFPFSRLVHIWSAPVGYLGRSYQVVRARGGTPAGGD